MTNSDLIKQRFINQQLIGTKFTKPVQLVKWFGAMQAQDYVQAKWAIGTRLRGSKDVDIESDFNAGRILRTHVLRPTWHFVSPRDIRWMLKLSAPRINLQCAGMNKKLRLDKSVFSRSNNALVKALEGGDYLIRRELESVLHRAKIATDGLRFTFMILRAELEGIICSGPIRGKQFTYALLDLRAPLSKTSRDITNRGESIAELSKRYFASHGPATLQDFSWWSGLSLTEAKLGIEMIEYDIMQEVINDIKVYRMKGYDSAKKVKYVVPAMRMLPAFDEFTVAYRDRSAVVDRAGYKKSSSGLNPSILSNGRMIGIWKRSFKKGKIIIEINPFDKLSRNQKSAIDIESKRYADFLEMKL